MSKWLALALAAGLAAFLGLREWRDYQRWNDAWDNEMPDWYRW